MSYNESKAGTGTAKVDMPMFSRVVEDATGQLTLAGATDRELGTLNRNAFVGDAVSYRFRNAEGTCQMIASGAIGLNVEVFAAASGKVASTGTVSVGISRSSASAADDQIEVLRW